MTRFFLWFSGDTDGLVMLGPNVRTFPTLDALCDYCVANGLTLSSASTAVYDLDAIDAWIAAPNGQHFDAHILLNTWNMMDDFYKTIGEPGAIRDDALDLHEKLSLSNFAVELPGVFTPETYAPEWTDSDRTRIASVLNDTTTRFKNALPDV